MSFMHCDGKSVGELTEFCKKLAKGEANMSGDSDIDDDLERPFHHPFVVTDRPPIVMNIKVVHSDNVLMRRIYGKILMLHFDNSLECKTNPAENRRANEGDSHAIPRVVRPSSSGQWERMGASATTETT